MQPRVSHKALLACGVLASLTYVASDITASLRYPGYNFIDQTVSELFAIGAPTSRIVVPLFTLSSTLLAAFAFAVWASCGPGRSRALRWLAIMMFANALNTLVLWNAFPLHMRGVAPTFTDAMHLVLAVNPFVLLSVLFGIAAFKGSFRAYSAITALILVVPAVFSFSFVTAVVANQPTPGMGLAERVAQYGYQLWQAMLAIVLLREDRQMMLRTSAFKTPEGEAQFLSAYDDEMKLWPVPYEQVDVRSRFGTTHVVICGPKTAPPLVLLHGYMATSVMWSPNIADFSEDYRVYAIDTMGQPSKSIPNEPIRRAADYVEWLTMTLDALRLDRVSLVGMSYGGWLAFNFTAAWPDRVRQLVLLSPGGGFLPVTKQWSLRGVLMVMFPTRFTVHSFMHWAGFTATAGEIDTRPVLDLMYLGLKHFRIPPETLRVLPTVFLDNDLRAMHVPTLLLIGEHEVIFEASAAVARARQLIPDVEAEIVPGCRHDMCFSQHRLVDARVLGFLKKRDHEPAEKDQRSIA